MDITYLGHSSFRIRGKDATIVTDPYDSTMVGLKFPKHIVADVVTVSHDHKDHNVFSAVEGNPFVVCGSGEYEVKGMGIVGISAFHDNEQGAKRGKNTIYRMEVDGVSIVHLGDLGHVPTTQQIEEIGAVDVLLIPVGGVYTLDSAKATETINEIEPSIVVPMHYGRPELNPKGFSDLAPLATFLKAMGKEDVAPQPKLALTKDKIPAELQVIVLT